MIEPVVTIAPELDCPGPSAAAAGAGAAASEISPAPSTDPAAASTASPDDNPAARRPLLSVAPMMDWTDVHFRQLARLLSRRTWLWTEMVVDKTVVHTQNLDKFLWFPPEQRPLVLQLGGSDPTTLAAAAARAVSYGYDEINLNCGCPSDRVAGAGCFGAALMMRPQLVAECMAAMAAAVKKAAAADQPGGGGGGGGPLPSVTVKCRLGVDEMDSYGQLYEFVRVVSEGSPVRHFIVHSRKAFLNGLSPHQNRTVPPLRHQWAWALARDFPNLQFSLNGGILNCHDARAAILTAHPAVPYTRPVLPPSDPRAAAAAVCGHLPPPTPSAEAAANANAGGGSKDTAGDSSDNCSSGSSRFASGGAATAPAVAATEDAISTNGGGIEGVMIGRGAYNDPWGCLADADRAVYGESYNPAPSRRWVIQRYREYAEPMVGRWHVKPDGHADPSVRTLMPPLLNLFHGEPGCKRWKNAVDEMLRAGPGSFGEVLDRTLPLIPDHVLDAPPRQPDLADLSPLPLDPRLPTPTSRAGQNQAPPGSKPLQNGGGGAAAAAASGGSGVAVAEVVAGSAAAAGDELCGCEAKEKEEEAVTASGAPAPAAAAEDAGGGGSARAQYGEAAVEVQYGEAAVEVQRRRREEAGEGAAAAAAAGGSAGGGFQADSTEGAEEAREAATGASGLANLGQGASAWVDGASGPVAVGGRSAVVVAAAAAGGSEGASLGHQQLQRPAPGPPRQQQQQRRRHGCVIS